jgi:predicted amidohydrolase YtcJ
MLYLPSNNWQQTLAAGQYKSSDDMFTFNSVKIQADGALGSRGAALIEDYSDHPGHKGLLLNTPKEFEHLVKTAMQHGFQVNSHAIGDNANKLVLDTYEKQIKASKSQQLRHRVEHAQVLRLADIPRFAELNIIASMQATHATSDKNMAQDRLGKKRILGAYAWRKLLNANAVIAAGSDFPVESPNPFYGLHASITRQDHKNSPQDGWFPEEKMTALEAFRSFTVDAAYSGHQENIIGNLAAGKKADFVLLEQNLFEMPAQDIWQMVVEKTWVNGKLVYQKN